MTDILDKAILIGFGEKGVSKKPQEQFKQADNNIQDNEKMFTNNWYVENDTGFAIKV